MMPHYSIMTYNSDSYLFYIQG